MAVVTSAVVAAGATVYAANKSSKAASSSQASQEEQNSINRDYLERQTAEAKSLAIPLFHDSMNTQRQGYQGALDILGKSTPQQMQAFQQGNIGAQQALLAGSPQVTNAILGLPADLSSIGQPQSMNFDTSWMQQQLPEVTMNPALVDQLAGISQQSTQGMQEPLDPNAGYMKEQDVMDMVNKTGKYAPMWKNIKGAE